MARPAAHGSETELWGELRLIGGAEAARAIFNLSPEDHRIAAEWLPDFIHRYGAPESWASVAPRVARYVKYLETVRRASAGWPNGVRAPGPGDRGPERERVQAFFETIGFTVDDSRGRVTVGVDDSASARERIGWLAAAGVDVKAIAPQLNAGEAVPIRVEMTLLPLPLPSFWAEVVFKPGHEPIADLIADRKWALVYLGLLSFDDDTLGFLAAHPGLVRTLHDAAPAFAAFAADSFRVRNGRVDLPGGSDAEPIWRTLIGARASEPDDFLRQLVSRDNGRLAYFYSALARLDRQRQAFALGGHLPAGTRSAFVQRAYASFRTIDPAWDIDARPFHRPSPDPSLMLTLLDVDAGLVGPGWMAPTLDRVVTNDEWLAAPGSRPPAAGEGQADLAWSIDWVFARPAGSAARLKLLRFAQRHAVDLDRSDASNRDDALRGAWQMPALAFALERMGVTDIALYARLARTGHALTTSASDDRTLPRLARWQAALALVEQLQRRRPLPPAQRDPILAGLADAGTRISKGENGIVANWLFADLLAGLSPATPRETLTERDFIHALVRSPDARALEIEWEGLPYILDEAGPVERDVVALREASPGPDLGRLLVLTGLRDRLAAPGTSAEALRSWLSEFAIERSTVERLPLEADRVESLVETFDGIVTSLNKIKATAELPRIARQIPAVGALIDGLTDVIVPPLVYALAVTPLNRPAGIFADTWQQHSLHQPAGEVTARGLPVAWRLPSQESRPGGGTTFRGSFFGLDLALASAELRRASTAETKAAEPQINVLGEAVALARGLVTASAASSGVEALARGRATLASWLSAPPGRQQLHVTLTSAGVDPRRANAVAWTLAHDPEATGRVLTLAELVRLGDGRMAGAWGVMRTVDGCPCTTDFNVGPIERWRGSWPDGVAAALTPDLSIRLAEHLIHAGLPAFLVDVLRRPATLDWMAHLKPFTNDDWAALSIWPRDLPDARIEEYLLALRSRGVLVAPGTGRRE
jgi:hypothetical protein